MKELLIILVSSAIVHNVVLSQFLVSALSLVFPKRRRQQSVWAVLLYSLLHYHPLLQD